MSIFCPKPTHFVNGDGPNLDGLCFLSVFGLSIYYLAKTIKTTSKTCLVQAGRCFSLTTTLSKLTRLLKGPKFKVGPWTPLIKLDMNGNLNCAYASKSMSQNIKNLVLCIVGSGVECYSTMQNGPSIQKCAISLCITCESPNLIELACIKAWPHEHRACVETIEQCPERWT